MKDYFNNVTSCFGYLFTTFGIVSQIKEIFGEDWEINLIVIVTGLYLAALGALIKKKKKISNNVTRGSSLQVEERENEIKKEKRKLNKRITFLTIIWIIVVCFLIIWSKTCLCRERSDLGIVICRFEEKNDKLRDHISDGIKEGLPAGINANSVVTSSRFLSLIQNKDEVLNEFYSKCFSSGLIVCGDYSKSENTFRCAVYVVGLNKLTKDTINLKGNSKPFFISNPSNIELATSEEITTNFVLGLLYYNSQNYSFSRSEMEEVVSVLGDAHDGDRKAKSLCYNIIASTYFKERDTSSAREFFNKALNVDTKDTIFKNNLKALNEYIGSVQKTKESYQNSLGKDTISERFPSKLSAYSKLFSIYLLNDNNQYYITKDYLVLKAKGDSCRVVGKGLDNDLTQSYYNISDNKKISELHLVKGGVVENNNGKKIGSYEIIK